MDEQMVSTFMEVTSCESQSDAVQHLGSCRWNLDEAINLYFSNAGGITKPSDPILPEEDVLMEEATDHGGDCEDDDGRAPIPSIVAAPSPALSEIVPTGWGEAQPDGCGGAGVENVGGGQEVHDDGAEREDNIGGGEDDGSMYRSRSNGEEYGEYNDEEDNEQDDDMSYNEDEDEYDEEVYYASLAEETGADGERPWPAQPQPGKDALEELFRPPFELMYRGSFHNAKVHAAREDRFLLVNLQTSSGAGDFPSQAQNRDLWANEMVKDVVKNSFVFFLLQKRERYLHIDECSKVSSFYKLDDDQLPAVLVLDPITGQLLAKRSGTVMPDDFMEYIDEYTKLNPSSVSKPKFVKKAPMFPAADVGEQEQEIPKNSAEQEQEIPKNSAAASSACSEQDHVPVPETELPADTEMVDDDDEPMEGETMYKLRIRFPDGTIVAKEFGCKRRVASLYAFCRSAIHGGGQAEEKKAIRIMRFAGRAMVAIEDDGGATFEDLGLNCAAVSVVFDT